MSVNFLTPIQRERYGQYPGAMPAGEIKRDCHLDDEDREWMTRKRRDSSRLGYTLPLITARFLGICLEGSTFVPQSVMQRLAAQIDVVDPGCVSAYQESQQRWRHIAESRLTVPLLPEPRLPHSWRFYRY